MIDDVLASGTKSSYRFAHAIASPDDAGQIQTCTVRAAPRQPGVTRKNYYYTDQSDVIREEEGKEADSKSRRVN